MSRFEHSREDIDIQVTGTNVPEYFAKYIFILPPNVHFPGKAELIYSGTDNLQCIRTCELNIRDVHGKVLQWKRNVVFSRHGCDRGCIPSTTSLFWIDPSQMIADLRFLAYSRFRLL